MCELRRSSRRRTAFTLIELLVVIALLLVIAAIGLGYGVFAQDNQHSVTGANAITGALLNAKQRARHDGLPTGIRLLLTNTKDVNGNPAFWASQLELVQQPEDYNAGQCLGNTAPNILAFTGVDFLGGAQYIGQIDQSTIQAGDYFVVSGVSTPHRINTVFVDANNHQSLQLDSLVTVQAGQAYSIIRGPRRLASEDLIQLPPSIVVDDSSFGSLATLCQNLPFRTLVDSNNPNPPGVPVAEIVFAPSGALIGQGTSADKVLLWLRDPSQTTVTGGAPVLVSVQVRTGLISVCPVAPWNGGAIGPNNDPYAFAKDGRASGM